MALERAADIASAVAGAARDSKAISTGLDMIGQSRAADIARRIGLGRKRRRSSRHVKKHKSPRRHAVKKHIRKHRGGRKMKGGSFLGDIIGKVTSIPAGLLIGATAGAQQAFSGLGRKRRRHSGRGQVGGGWVPEYNYMGTPGMGRSM